MADTNRAVIYHGTKDVRVENVSDAGFVLEDGPGVHPDNVSRELPHARLHRSVRGQRRATQGLKLSHVQLGADFTLEGIATERPA